MAARAQGMNAEAEALPSSPLPFVAITPCRIVDTRVAVSNGFHQPNFADDEARTFPFPSSPDCPGLPATAGAYSVNVQFRPMTQPAYLTAYPTGTAVPGVSTLTAGPASWVGNAAIVPAGTGGAIDIYCQYAGRVVIDVNGYYGPQSVVTSLNTLTGDVTLGEGSNIAITPSGNTLTIAMTGVPGGELPAGTPGQTLYSNGSGWLASSALTNDGTNIGIANNLLLPETTPTTGQITLGGNRFIHNYGPAGAGNTFVGQQAGNFTMGGTDPEGKYNTASGAWSLSSNTTGSMNTASGVGSLMSNTTGINNTASGAWSLQANTTGSYNTASGTGSLWQNTTGSSNTASGAGSLNVNTAGFYNTASGDSSLASNTTGSRNTASGLSSLANNTTANRNTAFGDAALLYQSYDNGDTPWDTDNTAVGCWAMLNNSPDSASDGYRNTAVGSQSLYSNITGSNNIAVGYNAGYNLTTGNWNIDIGNQGVAAEGNTIRIGDSNQSRTFIAGIRGVTPGVSDGLAVIIDSNGQLGTSASAGAVTSVFGRTGVVLAAVGDYTATQIVGLTSGGVTFGGSSGSFAQDTSNIFWDDTNKRLGIGTNVPSQQLDLSGMVRMPMTAATAGTPTAGVLFLGTDRFLHNYGPVAAAQNTFVGESAGNFTMGGAEDWDGGSNVGIGYEALASNTTGWGNAANGWRSLSSNTTGYRNAGSGASSLEYNTTGYQNTASGSGSLLSNTMGHDNTASGSGSLYSNTTGNSNTASGVASLYSNTTGHWNIALGFTAGYNLTTGSYNIDIGNQGVAADGNTIRIGDSNQTSAFMAGIRGVTTGEQNAVEVLIDSNGQLGTISSSIRFKRDVAEMGDASSRLMALRPVTFRYKAYPDGPLQYGLIAEEVENVMPELVVRDATGQVETVAYHELPAMLLNELQKQQAKIERLQSQIEALRRQVEMLLAAKGVAAQTESSGN